jgi:hypothetical protein
MEDAADDDSCKNKDSHHNQGDFFEAHLVSLRLSPGRPGMALSI